MDNRDTVEALVAEFGAHRSDRSGRYDSVWEQICERVLPHYYFQGHRRDFANERQEVYDATAALALERFGAAMESMLTPRSSLWHGLLSTEKKLEDDPAIAHYLEIVRDVLFKWRRRPEANFDSQMQEAYISLGAIGTGAVSVEDDIGRGIRYRSVPMHELYIVEDAAGRIDQGFRHYKRTARQLIQEFPQAMLPELVTKAANDNQTRKFEILHVVKPNRDRDPERADADGMKFRSWHCLVEAPTLLRTGGFRTFPYAVSRYVTAPGEVYGRSPAHSVLPEIKMANRINRTMIDQANRAAEPPLLASDDDLPVPLLSPNAVNPGWLNRDGMPKLRPLETGAQFQVGLEMLDQRHRLINDAFLVTLFQILVDTPAMTATEAMLRAQEKGALLAPTMGRQQTELLGPIIAREIDILSAMGKLPEMPPALVEAGGSVEIEYLSPLARAQKLEQATGLMKTLEVAGPLGEQDPAARFVVDGEKALRLIAEVNGVPLDVLRPPKVVAQLVANQNQAGQMQALAEMAPGLNQASQAARNLDEAGVEIPIEGAA